MSNCNYEQYMALATEVFLNKENLPIHIESVVREKLIQLWSGLTNEEKLRVEPTKIAIEPLTN